LKTEKYQGPFVLDILAWEFPYDFEQNVVSGTKNLKNSQNLSNRPLLVGKTNFFKILVVFLPANKIICCYIFINYNLFAGENPTKILKKCVFPTNSGLFEVTFEKFYLFFEKKTFSNFWFLRRHFA
jgi:hypothetical protein